MVSTNDSTVDNDCVFSRRSHHRSGEGRCSRGNWSVMNIATMVLGFMLFWPLGLVILFWIISGRDVRDIPDAIKQKWSDMFGSSQRRASFHGYSNSENAVFDEFQQTQFDRISEIKEEIKNRARSFGNFRANARRRAQEKEFQDFMSSNPDQHDD